MLSASMAGTPKLQPPGEFLVKRITFASLSILLLLNNAIFAQAVQPKPVPTSAAAQKSVEVPFVNKKLANGLEVIVLPDSSVPLVTVELDVRNGSFTESPEFHGLSHLYEHMFFKPNMAARLRQCRQLPANFTGQGAQCAEIKKMAPLLGDISYLDQADQLTHYNGSTREEVVNYFYTTTSKYLAATIRSINDSVRYPVFNEDELEQEKQIVIGEIDRHESNPYLYLDQTMKEKLFFKYPTRKDPKGTRESVRAATVEKMQTIRSRYYVPNNAALIVTGDVDPQQVFKLAEQIMGSWEPRKVDPFKEFPLVEHPPLTKSEGFIIEKEMSGTADDDGGRNVFINIGWHGPSIGKDDAATYAADVFSYIIQQPDSRFQRKMVDSGLASSVGFGYYTQRNVGPINLVMVVSADKAKEAINTVYREVAAFADRDYYTDEELESAKTILESNDLFDREKLSEYAHTLGFWWSSTGIEYFRGYHKNLRATSRADIERYLKTYVIGKPHISIALLSPEAQKQAKLTGADLIGGK